MEEDRFASDKRTKLPLMGVEEILSIDDRWHWLGDHSTETARYECISSHLASDPKQWREIKQQVGPRGRCSHSMTPISEHTLLLFGGGYSTEDGFQHLNDLWVLSALTARWTRLNVVIKEKPSPKSEKLLGIGNETPESYWGMEFGPARRGHMVGYYEHEEAASKPPPRHFSLRHNHVSTKGRLIVFGGITSQAESDHESSSFAAKYLNDVWVLDLPTFQWRQIHPPANKCRPPDPRRAGISWVDGDFFHVLGGDIYGGGEYALSDDHNNNAAVPVYKLGPLSRDVAEWTWSIQYTWNSSFLHKRAPNWPMVTLNPKPFGVISHASHAIVGRKLWIFGGLDMSQYEASNLFYRLDLDTREWVVIHAPKKAPCPRYFHGMASLGRFLVVAGGIGFVDERDVVADVALEATSDGSSDEDVARENHEEVSQVTRERTLFDLYIFDTESMKWKQEHPQDVSGAWPCARNAFTLSTLGSNKIILFGGGVYPSSYFGETFSLEFDLPIKVPKPNESALGDVSSDMGELYRTGSLSDVKLTVKNEHGNTSVFPAHKAILAARCDYFKTMFEGPYAESCATEVCLPEFDAEAVDVVLRFLYTGMVDTELLLEDDEHSHPGIVSAVLRLSDLWNCSKLCETLENALISSMQKGLADPIELIAFAKAHNCKRLVTVGLEFAKRKWQTLKDSPSAKAADPEILEEIEDFVHSLL